MFAIIRDLCPTKAAEMKQLLSFFGEGGFDLLKYRNAEWTKWNFV